MRYVVGRRHVRKLKTRFFTVFASKQVYLPNEYVVKKGEVNERRYMCEMMLCSEYKKSNAFPPGIIKLQTADFIGIENKLCIGTSLKRRATARKLSSCEAGICTSFLETQTL